MCSYPAIYTFPQVYQVCGTPLKVQSLMLKNMCSSSFQAELIVFAPCSQWLSPVLVEHKLGGGETGRARSRTIASCLQKEVDA